jgi:primosomal protein N' (replication factor Y)
VPEVALATQVLDVFAKRFGGRVAALHSYLPVGTRRKNWELARRGALDVVVGARSAVFAPLPNLKLIVVDEEHEPAYKQSEQLRYHGRDVAVRRAQMLGIPVVLGSATPSLETQANAARGKYRRLVLAERCRQAPGAERARRGPAARGERARACSRHRCARRSVNASRAGEQTLLWLNRRGHSHHIQCRGCGHTPQCPHCDISLTLHVEPKRLRCHYCDHREAVPATCPKCGAALLRYAGAGTQRAERELATVFPNARVLRLDLDVARANAGPGAVLSKFARGDGDILLGTQMIAKGLDFPRVTLVGVIDADVALHLPDFRAAERTFQLLVQVAGRSGRGKQLGEVLVQTCTPEHAAVTAVAATNLEAGERVFRKRELDERREAGYPPFTRLVTLLVDGPDEAHVERAAVSLAERRARARRRAGHHRARARPAGVEPAARALPLARAAQVRRGSAAARDRGGTAGRVREARTREGQGHRRRRPDRGALTVRGPRSTGRKHVSRHHLTRAPAPRPGAVAGRVRSV